MTDSQRPLRVFLSYASQDRPAVRELYKHLKAEGWIDPWLDEEKLTLGQHWTSVIEDALDAADVVIIFLSRNSVQKEGFIQRELNYAWEISLEKPRNVIFLIPFRLDDCEVPRYLRSRQWGDYFGEKKESTYQTLLRSLLARHQQKLRLEAEELTRKEELARRQAEESARLEEEKRKQAAAEKAAREKTEREAAEKAAKEKAEKEAAEKAAREKAEQEAKEKAAQEKAEREATEIATREKAEREAEKKALREKEKREAAEKTIRERAARKAALAENLSRVVSSLKSYVPKAVSTLRVMGILGVIAILFWGISLAVPKFLSLIPTVEPSATITLTPTKRPTSTATFTPSLTKTFTPTPTITSTPTLTPIPQSSILYEEDFEDGEAQGWTDSVGTQSVEEDKDGNLYFSISGPKNYPQSWLDSDYIDMSDWTDYAFETRVRFISGTLFMCARADGGSAFYTFYTFSNDNHIALSEYDVAQGVEWGGYDIDKKYTINHNKWYTFRFELDKSTLSFYIDDELVVTTEANLPLVRESGGIGFYIGGNEEVHFDDIRVWSLR